MVQFGVCTALEQGPMLRAQGWDFVEANIQNLLQGLMPEAEWTGLARVQAAAVAGGAPVRSGNLLVPKELKITGPAADLEILTSYIDVIVRRARLVGMETLVFGSGAARQVPDGFDRAAARQQALAFLQMAGPRAAAQGVTIVLEPLHSPECNFINTLAEAMEYVRAVNHPAIRCLVDSYHLWKQGEALDQITAAGKAITHVHVADLAKRAAPGASGQSDYRAFFGTLKRLGYDRRISVECGGLDVPTMGARVLEFLQKEWEAS